MGFWWLQNEAIIATLLAWQLTGDEKYARWHQMAHDWAYAHFPIRSMASGTAICTAMAFHADQGQSLEGAVSLAADAVVLLEAARGNGGQMTLKSAVSTPAFAQGSAWYFAGICLVASIGGLLFGFDTAVISGAVELSSRYNSASTTGRRSIRRVSVVRLRRRSGCGRSGRRPFPAQAGIDRLRCPLLSIVHRLRRRAGILAVVRFAVYRGHRHRHGVGARADVHLRIRAAASSRPARGDISMSIVIGLLVAYFSNWQLSVFRRTMRPWGTRAVGRRLLAMDHDRRSLAGDAWRGRFSFRRVFAASRACAGKPAPGSRSNASSARPARS